MIILRINAPSIWLTKTKDLRHDLIHQTHEGVGAPMHTHLRLRFPLFSGGCRNSQIWQVVPQRLKEIRNNSEEDKWKDNFDYPWRLGY